MFQSWLENCFLKVKKAFRYVGNRTCIQDTFTGPDSSQHKVVAQNIKKVRVKKSAAIHIDMI